MTACSAHAAPATLAAQDEDFRADFGLPLLTEHDVDCIRSLGCVIDLQRVALQPPPREVARDGRATPGVQVVACPAGACIARSGCTAPNMGLQLAQFEAASQPCSSQFEIDFITLSFCNRWASSNCVPGGRPSMWFADPHLTCGSTGWLAKSFKR